MNIDLKYKLGDILWRVIGKEATSFLIREYHIEIRYNDNTQKPNEPRILYQLEYDDHRYWILEDETDLNNIYFSSKEEAEMNRYESKID